jgi:hypothetical protein
VATRSAGGKPLEPLDPDVAVEFGRLWQAASGSTRCGPGRRLGAGLFRVLSPFMIVHLALLAPHDLGEPLWAIPLRFSFTQCCLSVCKRRRQPYGGNRGHGADYPFTATFFPGHWSSPSPRELLIWTWVEDLMPLTERNDVGLRRGARLQGDPA